MLGKLRNISQNHGVVQREMVERGGQLTLITIMPLSLSLLMSGTMRDERPLLASDYRATNPFSFDQRKHILT